MEKMKVLLCCEDREYGIALAECLVNLEKDFFVLCDCTPEKAAEKDVDFVLVEGNVAVPSDRDCGRYLFLVEKREEERAENEIYKYEKISEIAELLRARYRKLTGNGCLLKGTRGILIGFTGASGGVGKSAVAIGTARALAEDGRKNVLSSHRHRGSHRCCL